MNNLTRRDFVGKLLGTFVSSGLVLRSHQKIEIPKTINTEAGRIAIFRMSERELKTLKCVLDINYEGNWETLKGGPLLDVSINKDGISLKFDNLKISVPCHTKGFFICDSAYRVLTFGSFKGVMSLFPGDQIICTYNLKVTA